MEDENKWTIISGMICFLFVLLSLISWARADEVLLYIGICSAMLSGGIFLMTITEPEGPLPEFLFAIPATLLVLFGVVGLLLLLSY